MVFPPFTKWYDPLIINTFGIHNGAMPSIPIASYISESQLQSPEPLRPFRRSHGTLAWRVDASRVLDETGAESKQLGALHTPRKPKTRDSGGDEVDREPGWLAAVVFLPYHVSP